MASHELFGILFCGIVLQAVQCQDFDFACPTSWIHGDEYTLQCELLRATFSAKQNGGRCDAYSDTVVFQKTNAEGIKSQPCTVLNFDNTCDGSLNNNGCGCKEIRNGKIIINYRVTADITTQQNAQWECLPQCFDNNGHAVLSPPNTTACFRTTFQDDFEELNKQKKATEQAEDERDIVGGSLGGVVIVITCCGGVGYAFILKKSRLFKLTSDTTLQQLSTEAEKALAKDGLKKTVSILLFCDVGNSIFVLIHSRNLLKLKKAVKEMKSNVPGLEEVKHHGKESRDPLPDYPGSNAPGSVPLPKYTGKGNGKKNKSDKEIQLSSVRGSSPPSETSGNENTQMIPPTKGRALPKPGNHHDPISTGIASSASPRLEHLQNDSSKLTSVERNSGAFTRELPTPRQQPLAPIPPGKTA